MKRIRRIFVIALLVFSFLAYWSYRDRAAIVRAAEYLPIAPTIPTLPAGTEIQAVLAKGITDMTRPGDPVSGFIAKPVLVHGVPGLPNGIQLQGTVDKIETRGQKAEVCLHFNAVLFNGKTSPMETKPVSITTSVENDIGTLASGFNTLASAGIGIALGTASQDSRAVAVGLARGAMRGVPAPTVESTTVTLVLTAPLKIAT